MIKSNLDILISIKPECVMTCWYIVWDMSRTFIILYRPLVKISTVKNTITSFLDLTKQYVCGLTTTLSLKHLKSHCKVCQLFVQVSFKKALIEPLSLAGLLPYSPHWPNISDLFSFPIRQHVSGCSSGEAGRPTHVWRGIRPLLSFVTQTISEAAEVNWDTAVGESKVMLTALVKSFLCDFVCDLCGWVVCEERAKQQEMLCCHLSVRGDSGHSC